jgi:hypothetical protein
MNEIANVLQNYSRENPTAAAPQEVDNHFTQVAQAAPPSALAGGLAAMFRSDQTPAFGQMVGQLFSNSNGSQRATLLNALLTSPAAAGIISQLTQATGIKIPSGPGGAQITPETAAQISPEAVQQAAAHAEQHDPSIVDRVSEIYAEHPALVKTLGAAAMGLALSHLANRRN